MPLKFRLPPRPSLRSPGTNGVSHFISASKKQLTRRDIKPVRFNRLFCFRRTWTLRRAGKGREILFLAGVYMMFPADSKSRHTKGKQDSGIRIHIIMLLGALVLWSLLSTSYPFRPKTLQSDIFLKCVCHMYLDLSKCKLIITKFFGNGLQRIMLIG